MFSCAYHRQKSHMLRLHSILQPPWLTAVSKSSNQASRDLTYQIYANPSFACRNQNHRHAPRPLSIQTQEAGLRWNCHAPLCAEMSSEKFPRATSDSWLSYRLLGTRAAMTASSSTDLLGLRIWWSTAIARASTRHLGFWLLLHAPVNTHTPTTCQNQLLMSSDVIGWHHHSMSAATQARLRQP